MQPPEIEHGKVPRGRARDRLRWGPTTAPYTEGKTTADLHVLESH